ncbi:hypothetical protein CYLTODRAFT_447385 [Cylindrobasidium torrendii FP15055 ss-10]|uniref:Uncharacterized protein n=1 Tax=Cylindrobasidium torrendii FP15055 ss-10 TaxID=1314674 RepID=A0A0D7AUR2_9AGAR|nr:hypothetical protein CYLTODRAFT_447385 [Cylindrobasidium torrendii FP15055 ss-10]
MEYTTPFVSTAKNVKANAIMEHMNRDHTHEEINTLSPEPAAKDTHSYIRRRSYTPPLDPVVSHLDKDHKPHIHSAMPSDEEGTSDGSDASHSSEDETSSDGSHSSEDESTSSEDSTLWGGH